MRIGISSLLLQCHAPITIFPPTPTRPLVVGFTGTSSFSDVVDDVRFFARPWPPDEEESEALVHGGFADRTTRLCSPDLLATLMRHPDAILAGHSAGGACAVLLAAWVAQKSDVQLRHQVYTFGAPRFGNEAFCELYRRDGLWERTLRHRTPHDPVVSIPPWLCHVGVETVVESDECRMAQHKLESYGAE